MAAEGDRNQSARTRSRRVYEGRRLNYQEASPDYAVTLFDTIGPNVDTTDEATAVWGPIIDTDHYERIMLDLEFLLGAGDVTTVHIAAQAATTNPNNAASWFDVYRDQTGAGTLLRWVEQVATGAGDLRIAWMDRRRVSRFMRFKVWTTGGTPTRTGTRVRLRGQRVMDAA